MRSIFILLTLFSTSCVTTQERNYSNKWEEKKNEYLSQMVSPHCPPDDGVDECGILAEKLPQKWPKFQATYCVEHKLGSPACGTKYVDIYMAKLKLRYPKADWAATNLWCEANATICDFSKNEGVVLFEMHLLTTHNRAVASEAGVAHDEIELQASQAQHQRDLELQQVFGHIGDGNLNTVHCTSQAQGDTTYTNCH